MLNKLKNIWSYSDSQPTEITLALANIALTHIAIGIELGGLYIFRIIIFFSGLYHLYCVANGDLNCRVKASVITFAVYSTSTIAYLSTIGFPCATHYGWLVLCFASFGSMRRLILEKIHKEKIK
jgi:hypothetical protein